MTYLRVDGTSCCGEEKDGEMGREKKCSGTKKERRMGMETAKGKVRKFSGN